MKWPARERQCDELTPADRAGRVTPSSRVVEHERGASRRRAASRSIAWLPPAAMAPWRWPAARSRMATCRSRFSRSAPPTTSPPSLGVGCRILERAIAAWKSAADRARGCRRRRRRAGPLPVSRRRRRGAAAEGHRGRQKALLAEQRRSRIRESLDEGARACFSRALRTLEPRHYGLTHRRQVVRARSHCSSRC